MTPTHSDSPLRKSELGIIRSTVSIPKINDDEEERREARRQSARESLTNSNIIEENETLKNCLKIYHENKLSKENAWSVSLIDTLSILLDKHHKSLNNFKVAGSSLEASSKVYGLRVDSIHIDVIRLSSGLGNQKWLNHEGNKFANREAENILQVDNVDLLQTKRKKNPKKQVSTITKNKETINGRLDTNPFTDPIFAKLNSIVGSINSSNRLLQNVLLSCNSELKLRTNTQYWDSDQLRIIVEVDKYNFKEVDLEILISTIIDHIALRPNHSGYFITDVLDDVKANDNNDENQMQNVDDNVMNSLAFDIDGNVEQIHIETNAFIDIDVGELDDLTADDQIAINNCKGLRRIPIIFDDLRPIDSTSATLEYSYRPLDKIGQFWAGPSHWKFKRSRSKSFSLALEANTANRTISAHHLQRNKNKKNQIRSQQVVFGEIQTELFHKIYEKQKNRKINIQKCWDARKLKLPTDLQIEQTIFDVYKFAPGIRVHKDIDETLSPDLPLQSTYNYDNADDKEYCSKPTNNYCTNGEDMSFLYDDAEDNCKNEETEIFGVFTNAPNKVTKIAVPFAKRAKVVDMKELKKNCLQEIKKQFNEATTYNSTSYQEHPKQVASFKVVYENLPKYLPQNQSEALSPSIAFYSILHLANEKNLKLIQNDNLEDFLICQYSDSINI